MPRFNGYAPVSYPCDFAKGDVTGPSPGGPGSSRWSQMFATPSSPQAMEKMGRMGDEAVLGVAYGLPLPVGRNALDRRKRPTNRGRCEHATFPVVVLPVGGGEKKIAHCLGCGRSGPVAAGSTEALAALRKAPRLASQQSPA